MPSCRNRCLAVKEITITLLLKNTTRGGMTTKATILATLLMASIFTTSASAQTGALDRGKVLRAAADALGMVRWSDVGAGTSMVPAIDVINTMEFVASGKTYSAGQAFESEYHAALGY